MYNNAFECRQVEQDGYIEGWDEMAGRKADIYFSAGAAGVGRPRDAGWQSSLFGLQLHICTYHLLEKDTNTATRIEQELFRNLVTPYFSL